MVINQKTIYITTGSSIGVVVKGQAQNYYDIHDFLKIITKKIEAVDVLTETMLVANKGNMSIRINFKRAEQHILDCEVEKLLPILDGGYAINAAERLDLAAKYAKIRKILIEDKQGLLKGLIKAKARGSANEVGQLLMFFPSFEHKLKQKLPKLIKNLYEDNWQKALDDLKVKERIINKGLTHFVFGDLCKIYKILILDKQIIDIAPVSEDEFNTIMNSAPLMRNKFAHTEPNLEGWDDLFSFCSKFVPIYSRLLEYFEHMEN